MIKLVLYGSKCYKKENIYIVMETTLSRSAYAKWLEDIYQEFTQVVLVLSKW